MSISLCIYIAIPAGMQTIPNNDIALHNNYGVDPLLTATIVGTHISYTVEPRKNGYIGGGNLVLCRCREVVPPQRLTSKPHLPMSRLNLLKGVVCRRLS